MKRHFRKGMTAILSRRKPQADLLDRFAWNIVRNMSFRVVIFSRFCGESFNMIEEHKVYIGLWRVSSDGKRRPSGPISPQSISRCIVRNILL